MADKESGSEQDDVSFLRTVCNPFLIVKSSHAYANDMVASSATKMAV